MTTVVCAEQVSISAGPIEIVHGISLHVRRGEWLALIGPNGAGKTTLLRALAGLIGATGRIEIDGHAVAAMSRRQRARAVAIVPQLPSTPPALTVAEYVLLGRTPHIGPLGSERRSDREAAARAVGRLSLESFVDRRLGTLSGGERQRVVLARALAQEAPVLLLDEPTSALDLGRQQEAFELLDALRREERLTVISAMHDLSLAAQYADRLMLLDAGRVAAQGGPSEVLTEAAISASYRAQVRIVTDDAGVFVLPRRRAVQR